MAISVNLTLRNPHSVLAALETRPQQVADICISARTPAGAWEQVARLAREHRIPVIQQPLRKEGGRRSKQQAVKSAREGTAEATVKPKQDVSLGELFAGPSRSGKPTGLWLALDHIQDPHNVGAIFRTAAFFGVQGIVLTKDRSAPLNATVFDVASGGMEYVPFSIQTNLIRSLEAAKDAGIWILGSSEHAGKDVQQIPQDRPWLLVLGNEEQGLRHLTREQCDEMCRLTPHTPVSSLNVSVAAGILIAALTAR